MLDTEMLPTCLSNTSTTPSSSSIISLSLPNTAGQGTTINERFMRIEETYHFPVHIQLDLQAFGVGQDDDNHSNYEPTSSASGMRIVPFQGHNDSDPQQQPQEDARSIAAQMIFCRAGQVSFCSRFVPEQLVALSDATKLQANNNIVFASEIVYLTVVGNSTIATRQGLFMVGETLTAADLAALSVICNWYKAFDRDFFVERYPELEEYIQHIALCPKLPTLSVISRKRRLGSI